MTTNEVVAPKTAAEFLRVSEAKKKYFGGTMSLRWWYRQIELGALAHRRVGSAVRLEVIVVEAFVAATLRDAPVEVPEPQPAAPRTRRRRSRNGSGGLRFFPDTS